MEYKKRFYVVIIVFIVITISFGSTTAYFYNDNIRYKGDLENLEEDYSTLMNNYDNLDNRYDELNDDYYNQIDGYNALLDDYEEIYEEYTNLYAPSTLIKNGTVHWRFEKVDGTIPEWNVDIDTYLYYAMSSEPFGYKHLHNTNTGEDYTVKDLTKYVDSSFFKNVISTLSNGKTDREFVKEVVHLKNQLITYASGLGDSYLYPAETLTEGRGKCGDTSILMASLLLAGEEKENYGLDVYFWYCDSKHMTNPQEVNHCIVQVEYNDGYFELIEPTSDTFYTYGEIEGWKFEV